MDLSKATNEKKLYLCKCYFRAGLAFLPFIWSVNVIWFFNDAFRKPEFEEQRAIKKYVMLSAIGSIVWLLMLLIWVSVFQFNRADWGEFADAISFIIPLGTP